MEVSKTFPTTFLAGIKKNGDNEKRNGDGGDGSVGAAVGASFAVVFIVIAVVFAFLFLKRRYGDTCFSPLILPYIEYSFYMYGYQK